MAAPEDEDVVLRAGMHHLGQAEAGLTREDVGQIVGREVGGGIVDVDVGVHVLPPCFGIDGAGVGVARVVGQVVLGDENDVVVVKAPAAEQLVHVEDVVATVVQVAAQVVL